MGYYISHMIGIRTGGVFSEKVNIENFKKRIQKIILEMHEKDEYCDIGDENGDPSHCMSRELIAHKGSYIVIAGVFNYWYFEQASIFAKKLSKEFGVEILHMSWEEEKDIVQCQIWLNGIPLFETNEDPIKKILRRIT